MLKALFASILLFVALAKADQNTNIGEPLSLNGEKFQIVYDEQITNLCVAEANNERRNNGNLPPVSLNNNLGNAAQYHSNWMGDKNCFSHECPGEPTLGERVTMHNYNWRSIGEIIAAGYQDCGGAMVGWMNSPGHRNIVLGNFNHIGCGFVSCSNCQYRTYWTCVFANPL